MLEMLAACALSYVLGSIPTGLILGKLIWHTDLREHGSHNIGATNAWRTLGKGAGGLIFLCDYLKGIIGAWLGFTLVGTPLAMVISGLMAIAGHSCSLFLKFKGGKGVATGLGVIAYLMPWLTLLVFMVWFAIVYVTRYVSLGSCVAAALVPILAWFFEEPAEYIVFGIVAAVLIIVRHRANINRLLSGTENKI